MKRKPKQMRRKRKEGGSTAQKILGGIRRNKGQLMEALRDIAIGTVEKTMKNRAIEQEKLRRKEQQHQAERRRETQRRQQAHQQASLSYHK